MEKVYKDIEFKVFHIFREGNHCANKLTWLSIDDKLDFKWYDDLPVIIKLDLFL